MSPEVLFNNYYGRLCHFAWQLLEDKTMAEDIVQDVFASYWDWRSRLANDETAIKNFLYSAVRHACYNSVRHDKVRQRYFDSFQADAPEEPEVLIKIIRAEVMEEVYKALDELPDACRQIFRLGYLEGLTNPKIAEKLNISINTVKTQKQRGLKVLRDKLNPELFALLLLFLMD